MDLVGVDDPVQARNRVLDRIREALDGRAKPMRQPAFPHHPADPHGVLAAPAAGAPAPRRARRTPINPPPFRPPRWRYRPPGTPSQCSRSPGRASAGAINPGAPVTPGEVRNTLMGDLTLLMNDGVPRPDLLVVAGNLTESGSPREFSDALSFAACGCCSGWNRTASSWCPARVT
ncbi:hypothetical protein V2I01_36255 [Micromonospora sp. BRA006-A]|nr:hypothetical protein [Micromonospora sp. BRA006-A]